LGVSLVRRLEHLACRSPTPADRGASGWSPPAPSRSDRRTGPDGACPWDRARRSPTREASPPRRSSVESVGGKSSALALVTGIEAASGEREQFRLQVSRHQTHRLSGVRRDRDGNPSASHLRQGGSFVVHLDRPNRWREVNDVLRVGDVQRGEPRDADVPTVRGGATHAGASHRPGGSPGR
jgi:hypothetical protein